MSVQVLMALFLRLPHKNKFALAKVAKVELWLSYDANVWISLLSQTDIFPVRECFKVQLTKTPF